MIDQAILNRRSFLRLSAMAAAAGCVVRANAFAPTGSMNYGVQLYMVRRQAPSDLAGVLKQIRQIGFTEIELYPIVYTHPAPELKQIVADSGLACPAAHFNYDGLEDQIEYAHTLGLRFLVCPMIPREQWSSLEGFHKAADLFNRVGAKCRIAGMEFCFHNHCYEFRPMAGTTGFAELMEHTDPRLVNLEFDLYWLAQGGQDPAAMMKQYANRVRLIHLKDRIAGAPTSYDPGKDAAHFTELGKGSIPWPALIAQAKAQGIRHAFLDQDETAGPVFDSMRESYQYLAKLNV